MASSINIRQSLLVRTPPAKSLGYLTSDVTQSVRSYGKAAVSRKIADVNRIVNLSNRILGQRNIILPTNSNIAAYLKGPGEINVPPFKTKLLPAHSVGHYGSPCDNSQHASYSGLSFSYALLMVFLS